MIYHQLLTAVLLFVSTSGLGTREPLTDDQTLLIKAAISAHNSKVDDYESRLKARLTRTQRVQLRKGVKAWVEKRRKEGLDLPLVKLEIGSIGAVPYHVTVQQVTGATEFLGSFAGDTCLYRGFDTSGSRDDETVEILSIVKVSGTYRYITAIGSSRQVLVIDAADVGDEPESLMIKAARDPSTRWPSKRALR